MPLWQAGIADRFDALLEKRDLDLKGYDPIPKYITDIMVVAAGSSGGALAKVPPGYTMVMLNPGTNSTQIMDANESVGGDFVFIAYKLSPDKSKAIYDIQVIDGQNSANYTDKDNKHYYNKIAVDLNSNVGGDYIYLFYSKAIASDTQFVKEILWAFIRLRNEASLPAGSQWTKDRLDLNKGAGHDFIFLAYRMGP